MKYVFFGTPEASKIVLEQLVNAGHVPVAVVTNPDRPTGRDKALTASPMKQYAERIGAKVLQPEKVSSIASELSSFDPDVFLVAFYGKLIPANILSLARYGTLGVHPSLLPLYRGPSPIQTAILDGVSETGVTLYKMDEKMDEGPIIAQEKLAGFRVGEKSNISLWHELARLGGAIAGRIIDDFASGNVQSIAQDHARATYTKKFGTEDAFVEYADLEKAKSGTDASLAHNIHQMILAFTPEPGAWTMENGKRLKLLESVIQNDALVLKKVQYEGKKPIVVGGSK